MQLPLARLELTRTARRKSTHGLRFVAPAICVIALLLAWYFMGLFGSSSYETVNFAGTFVSRTVLGFLLFTACVLAPLFASGAIATEKQERTLGLLLLTNIRGEDLLAAKGLNAFLQVELLVLGCLPLQAIASLLGGLTLKMLVGQQIAAASLCLVTTALGLFCSSLAWRAIDAFFAAVGAIVVWLILASFADTLVLEMAGIRGASGLSTLIRTVDPSFAMKEVLLNGIYSVGVALLVAAIVWYRLPHLSDDTAMRVRATRSRPRYSRLLDRIRYLRLGPVDRLYAAAAAGVGGTLYRWPWWPLVVLITTVLAIIPINISGLLIAMLIVYDGVSCITSVRQNGGADTLFLTGAASHHIARGIHRAHLRRALLFLPAMLAADLASHGLWYSALSPQNVGSWQIWLPLISLLVSIGGSFVSLYAFTSLGCLASTWRSNPAMLTFKALLALLGVSVLSYMVSMIILVAAMSTSRATSTALSFSMAVQIFMMIPATLVLLGFAGAWQSRFGQKLARRWRTGAEA